MVVEGFAGPFVRWTLCGLSCLRCAIASERDSLSLLIAGDAIMNADLVKSNLSSSWAGIRHVIGESDAFFLNHEGMVTSSTDNISDPVLKESAAIASTYAAANVSFVSLANNHQSDLAQPATQDTMNFFASAGIPYAGVGRNWQEAGAPAIVRVKGKQIAVFATMLGPVYDAEGRGQACYPEVQCTAPADGLPGVHYIENVSSAARELKDRARRIKPHVDYVIMFFHWGSNWDWMDGSAGDIWKERQWLGRHLLDSPNVDMIWGTSAHHIQPVEVYNDKVIIYSSGNLIIPLPTDLPPGIPPPEFRTRLAFMFRLHLNFAADQRGKVPFSLEAIPVVSDDWTIEPVRNASDLSWLESKFNNISSAFGTKMNRRTDDRWFVVDARNEAIAV